MARNDSVPGWETLRNEDAAAKALELIKAGFLIAGREHLEGKQRITLRTKSGSPQMVVSERLSLRFSGCVTP